MGLDFEITPFGLDDERDKETAEFIEGQTSSIEGLEDVQNDLLDAIGKGFVVSEIMWGYDEGYVVVKKIKSWYQKRFLWDSVNDSFKICTAEVPQGIKLPTNKFILYRYRVCSGYPSHAGALRVIAWMHLFKNYDLKDWVSSAEICGLPLRLDKYQPGASEEGKRAFMAALVQIGADAAGIILDGTMIGLTTTEKNSSTNLYEQLARYYDEQILKAVLGQTSIPDSGGGGYAQSKTHNDVWHDLTVADCKTLAATLRRDPIRPLCIFNFEEDRRIPYLRFDCEEGEDLVQAANIVDTLIEKTGLSVPTSYLYKKFLIPKPEAEEEIARPPSMTGVDLPLLLFTAIAQNAPTTLKVGDATGHGMQARADYLVQTAVRRSALAFKEAFAPVLKLLERVNSLEELCELMKDDDRVAILYDEMDATRLGELLQKVLTYAQLEGRVVEDGRD